MTDGKRLKCTRDGKPWEIEMIDHGAVDQWPDAHGAPFRAYVCHFIVAVDADRSLEGYSVVDASLVDLASEEKRQDFLRCEHTAWLEGAGVAAVEWT